MVRDAIHSAERRIDHCFKSSDLHRSFLDLQSRQTTGSLPCVGRGLQLASGRNNHEIVGSMAVATGRQRPGSHPTFDAMAARRRRGRNFSRGWPRQSGRRDEKVQTGSSANGPGDGRRNFARDDSRWASRLAFQSAVSASRPGRDRLSPALCHRTTTRRGFTRLCPAGNGTSCRNHSFRPLDPSRSEFTTKIAAK